MAYIWTDASLGAHIQRVYTHYIEEAKGLIGLQGHEAMYNPLSRHNRAVDQTAESIQILCGLNIYEEQLKELFKTSMVLEGAGMGYAIDYKCFPILAKTLREWVATEEAKPYYFVALGEFIILDTSKAKDFPVPADFSRPVKGGHRFVDLLVKNQIGDKVANLGSLIKPLRNKALGRV